MSTYFLGIPNINLDRANVRHGKHFVVPTEREDLSDYLRRLRSESGASFRRFQELSGVHPTTLHDIISGRTKDVRASTLQKIERGLKALGVPEGEVFAVVRGKSLQPMTPTDFYTALEAMGVEQFQAYGGVENLTDEDRQEIVAMLQTMIEQKLIRRQKAGGNSKKKR
jgi:transcriptional regulator with XRE-family HTH domain